MYAYDLGSARAGCPTPPTRSRSAAATGRGSWSARPRTAPRRRSPANAVGARLATAPISSPPALPPRATSRSGAVQPALTRCSAQATKSVKVFCLASSLPSSYQLPAHLAAAADVRDREDEAAVQQRQPGDGEPRVHAGLVGAVAVEDGRGGAVARRARRGRPARSAPGCRPAACAHSRCCS